MPVRPYLVIVNPQGGRKRGLLVLEQVRPIFQRAGIVLDVRSTAYRGHATELVNECDLSTYGAVCVVGGDGTTHEVVAGMMRNADGARIPIGLISAGTGNTLHHHLGCGDPEEAARRIVAGNVGCLDVIRVTMGNIVEYCCNIIGWGVVVDINARAEGMRWAGTSRYSLAALTEILFRRLRPANILLDEFSSSGEFLFVLACNTKMTGAGMLVAPEAQVDDGKLDVVILRDATRRQALQLFRRVFDGTHLEMPEVEYRQVQSLAIETASADPLNLDGEMKGATPFAAEVIPAALRVFR
jgi:YegS/Rv2252/BmrU family lipid kinase